VSSPDTQHAEARQPVLGLLGGTGEQGSGLALRFAASGLDVVVGSRDPGRAAAAAADLSATLAAVPGAGRVSGADNGSCARQSDVVVVAVPWAAHEHTLRDLAGELAGRVVVDCVNPLGFDKRGAYALEVPQGSAAQQAAELLPQSRVVAAFHHVSAVLLRDTDLPAVHCDVLVLGEDREATDLVAALADRIPGMRGVFGGRLRNARQVEALTANLISVNRRYKTHAGVGITGV
jgi:NADPH-dependent F420 reductase